MNLRVTVIIQGRVTAFQNSAGFCLLIKNNNSLTGFQLIEDLGDFCFKGNLCFAKVSAVPGDKYSHRRQTYG